MVENKNMFSWIASFLCLYFGNGFFWNNEAQVSLFIYLCQHSPIWVKGQKFDFRSFLFLYCFNGRCWPNIIQEMLAMRLIRLYRILGQDELVEDKDISDKPQNLTEIVRSIITKWSDPSITIIKVEGQVDINPRLQGNQLRTVLEPWQGRALSVKQRASGTKSRSSENNGDQAIIK